MLEGSGVSYAWEGLFQPPSPPPPSVIMHGGGGVGSVASMDNSDAVEIFSMECAMHIMHSVLHCQ